MILDIQRRGGAAWLWMNRPEARNALSDELLAALETALEVLENDAAVRVLVLAGRGPAFCAGGDLAKMEKAAKMTKARSRREASRFAKLLLRMHAYPKPIVARVQGPAFAGGMGLVCLGFPLARMEGQVALPAVLAHWRRIELAVLEERLEWLNSMVFRGMLSLPLKAAR